MKKIALFGGSFNPPHIGHFEMAKYIYEALGVDEVWFLFSDNWQKNIKDYAPTKDRMEMGRILARQYPNMPFIMSDIQSKIDNHATYEVLKELKSRSPDFHFIWVMGADNMIKFHTWKHYKDIIQNFPIAVIDRPPYTQEALKSSTALDFQDIKISDPKELSSANKGWCFLNNPQIDTSSSNILKHLRSGNISSNNTINSNFKDVTNYIIENKLYGLNANLKARRKAN